MTKPFFKLTLLTLILTSLWGCSVFGIRSEPSPDYQIVTSHENFEIRQYPPLIVATTEVTGDNYKKMQEKAFQSLFDYISGENTKDDDISMTAPVMQGSGEGEEIAMTAPVQQSTEGNTMRMSFIMPSKYQSIDKLPRPVNDKVQLRKVPEKMKAVVTFSGYESKQKNQKMAEKLKTWLKSTHKEYEISSGPIYAGYDPPWTISYFRKNEIMFNVE